MKKNKLFIATLLLESLLASQTKATVIASGNDCGAEGSTCSWSVDDEGVLTISGNGYMKDYVTRDKEGRIDGLVEGGIPWLDYGNRVSKVKIEEGIKNISAAAFHGMGIMTSGGSFFELDEEALLSNPPTITYELPQSLETIGDIAFAYNYFLKDITIPENVTNIGASAFAVTALESITIPEGASIGEYAFDSIIDMQTGEAKDPASLTIYCSGDTTICDQHLQTYYPSLHSIALPEDKKTQTSSGSSSSQSSDENTSSGNSDNTSATAHTLKRIYTVEEASKLSKPTGNTFRLRYK
ncbi:MAG: leucine-rich repeat domain-containing protein [Alphaproteobacteria bacterium]|nr:leucine-rich repeat domain-containing protein [Alphaproteobacteria bacterium]